MSQRLFSFLSRICLPFLAFPLLLREILAFSLYFPVCAAKAGSPAVQLRRHDFDRRRYRLSDAHSVYSSYSRYSTLHFKTI